MTLLFLRKISFSAPGIHMQAPLRTPPPLTCGPLAVAPAFALSGPHKTHPWAASLTLSHVLPPHGESLWAPMSCS